MNGLKLRRGSRSDRDFNERLFAPMNDTPGMFNAISRQTTAPFVKNYQMIRRDRDEMKTEINYGTAPPVVHPG
jgi:hypothetical protein